MEENGHSSGSVITIEDGSGEFPFEASSANHFARPQSISNDSEITQAHIALSTAYNSLKQRLLRSETEKRVLKRELKTVVAKQRMTPENSPKMKRHPQRQDFTQSDASILRQKMTRGLEAQDGNYHQRHGSWGYTNDHSRTEDQYCKLMEIQLTKGEEERNRLEQELKEVRLKLTELSIKNDKIKRTDSLNQGKLAAPSREMEQKVKNSENRIRELSQANDTLVKQRDSMLSERTALKHTIAALENKLSGQQQQQQPTHHYHNSDNDTIGGDLAAQIQTLTTMALKASSELQRTKQMVLQQQQIILSLRSKLCISTQAVQGTVRSACQTDELMPRTLIRQAESGDSSTQIDAFGKYYLHQSNSIREAGGAVGPPPPPGSIAVHSPKHVLTPKLASENPTFAFVPIQTIVQNNIDTSATKRKTIHYQATTPGGDYVGVDPTFELSRDVNSHGYRQHNGAAAADARAAAARGFDIDDHVTTSRMLSEDIVINLETQQLPTAATTEVKRSPRICEENETPPPSPCRRNVTSRVVAKQQQQQQQSPPSSPPDEHPHHPGQQPEPTETSTSSDDIDVRFPVDMINENSYVNAPKEGVLTQRLINGTNSDFIAAQNGAVKTNGGSGVFNGLSASMHMAADQAYRQENLYVAEPVSPRRRNANTDSVKPLATMFATKSPDVRPKIFPTNTNNTAPDVRMKASNPLRYDTPLQQRKAIPVTDLPLAENNQGAFEQFPANRSYPATFTPQNHASFFDQRSPHFDTSPNRMMTSTDSPRTIALNPSEHRNGFVAPTRPNNTYVNTTAAPAVKLPQPVENSETGEHDSYRDRAGSNASDTSSCIICSKSFPPNATLKEKESHVNACLIERPSSVPETLECPVCKQIFPPDYTAAKLTEHVNQHFNEDAGAEYVILGN